MIDSAKLSGWFEAHAARLALYARQLNRERASDAVQEAFVSLMQQPHEPANVKGWLYRTVRNGAISAMRTDRARVRRHETLAAHQPGWFDARPDDRLDAAAAQTCLQTLPPQQREVIVLRIWADMGFPEIALLTGLPVSTVFDHYRRGLTAMREKMESSCQPNAKKL